MRYSSRRIRRRRLVVIAPHPDDDVIGCGGMLQRLFARNARCTIVYVTDGGASHVRSRRFPPPVLRAIREDEARAAIRALGIRAGARFLRAPDGKLAELAGIDRATLVATLAGTLARLRPSLLFVPWRRDPHPDHIATAQIAAEALARLARRTSVYAYGVWLPVRGTAADRPPDDPRRVHTLSLDETELARKRAAILAHRSQLGLVVDDDPDGFRIDPALLEQWLQPVERFYLVDPAPTG